MRLGDNILPRRRLSALIREKLNRYGAPSEAAREIGICDSIARHVVKLKWRAW